LRNLGADAMKDKCNGCLAKAVIDGSAHCAAPKCCKNSSSTLVVTQSMVLKAVYDSGLHQYAPGVLRASWKDGVDIDEPHSALMNFAEKICRAVNKESSSARC